MVCSFIFEMSDYDIASKGPLRLKGVNNIEFKKKKKKKTKCFDYVTDVSSIEVDVKMSAAAKKTKAEMAFLEMQKKREMERVLKKASKTHKERVEEFNKHLDTLTEHFDIPKVSWTK